MFRKINLAFAMSQSTRILLWRLLKFLNTLKTTEVAQQETINTGNMFCQFPIEHYPGLFLVSLGKWRRHVFEHVVFRDSRSSSVCLKPTFRNLQVQHSVSTNADEGVKVLRETFSEVRHPLAFQKKDTPLQAIASLRSESVLSDEVSRQFGSASSGLSDEVSRQFGSVSSGLLTHRNKLLPS